MSAHSSEAVANYYLYMYIGERSNLGPNTIQPSSQYNLTSVGEHLMRFCFVLHSLGLDFYLLASSAEIFR